MQKQGGLYRVQQNERQSLCEAIQFRLLPNESPMLLNPAAESDFFLLLCADRRCELELGKVMLYLHRPQTPEIPGIR